MVLGPGRHYTGLRPRAKRNLLSWEGLQGGRGREHRSAAPLSRHRLRCGASLLLGLNLCNGQFGLRRNDANEAMPCVPGQPQLVQLFPDANAFFGCIERGRLRIQLLPALRLKLIVAALRGRLAFGRRFIVTVRRLEILHRRGPALATHLALQMVSGEGCSAASNAQCPCRRAVCAVRAGIDMATHGGPRPRLL